MSVLSQIPDFYRTEFDTNWEHEVQQMRSRLKDYAVLSAVSGKEKKFNVFGKQTMQRKTTRGGATRRSDVVLDDYWLRPQVYELSNTFDEYDEEFLGDIVLPKSETIQSHVSAYRRTCDEVIVSGLGGIRYSGENGTVENALAQNVAVNYVTSGTVANSGLTLAKLIKAKSILGKAEALEPGDPLVFVYTQQQMDDLLNNVVEVKSSDYNQVKALYDGEVEYFMGFHFVRLESLERNVSTDVRTCFAYVKSGVKFADSGRKSHLDILPSESHSLQVRTTASLAASRTQDEKVVAVYCDESP